MHVLLVLLKHLQRHNVRKNNNNNNNNSNNNNNNHHHHHTETVHPINLEYNSRGTPSYLGPPLHSSSEILDDAGGASWLQQLRRHLRAAALHAARPLRLRHRHLQPRRRQRHLQEGRHRHRFRRWWRRGWEWSEKRRWWRWCHEQQ